VNNHTFYEIKGRESNYRVTTKKCNVRAVVVDHAFVDVKGTHKANCKDVNALLKRKTIVNKIKNLSKTTCLNDAEILCKVWNEYKESENISSLQMNKYLKTIIRNEMRKEE
jgi:hypothetical protein